MEKSRCLILAILIAAAFPLILYAADGGEEDIPLYLRAPYLQKEQPRDENLVGPNTLGNPTPTGAPQGPITVFWDDFEGANIWASSGLWHRVVNGTSCPPMYCSPVTSWYYGTDNGASCTYVGPTSGLLISPAITGISSQTVLRFCYQRQLWGTDHFEVSVSTSPTGTPRTILSALNSALGWTQSPDLSLGAYAGQTIYIVYYFSATSATSGRLGFMLDDVEVARPFNCDNAVTINCNDPRTGYSTGAIAEVPSYGCSATPYSGNEAQFLVNVPAQTVLTVNLYPAGGRNLDAFILNGCNPAQCVIGAGRSLTYPYPAAGNYYVFVDGLTQADNGAFDLEVLCQAPEQLACGDKNIPGQTSGLSSRAAYACSPKNYTGPEHAYLLNLPQQENLYVSINPQGGRDLDVLVFNANNFPNQCLGYGDDVFGALNVPAGNYIVLVEGANGAAGNYTLSVDCGPRMGCAAATMVSCEQTVNGNTATGSNQLVKYGCSSAVFSGPELLYRFDNPTEQTVSFDFTSTVPELSFFVFRSCDEGDCMIGGKDFANCIRFQPGTYYIVVDGESGASGPFSLNIQCSSMAPTVDLTPGFINLDNVQWSCQDLSISGNLQVNVFNKGGTPASGSFDIVIFEDVNLNRAWDGPGVDNRLGSTVFTGVLAPGQTQPVQIAISGTTQFYWNLIYAAVDTNNVLVEADETNNLVNTGEFCEYRPPAGTFSPQLKWEWTSSSTLPSYVEIDSTPLVINLTDDNRDGVINQFDIPEIVFIAGMNPRGFDEGVLRALRGDTGAELFTVSNSAYRVYSTDHPAAGDLDGDGLPEIVARMAVSNGGNSRNRLLCFEHDGTYKWTSDILSYNYPDGGAPAIADLDKDGSPEIIFGRDVFNANGTIKWVGTAGMGINPIDSMNGCGPMSIAADVDMDSYLEVVAGNTVYRRDGTILWQAPVGDGFAAVGNFNGEQYPEIALVTNGSLYLIDHNGSVIWGPVAGAGGGGTPTISDFDKDCQAEIGVAWNTYYKVYEADGAQRWQAQSRETSSGVTGSSVFDFDGDQSEEVVYRDEEDLRVFSGMDGSLFFSIRNTSHTWTEEAVIADVDRDGNAEIVVPSNEAWFSNAMHGIRVYGDPNWIATRGIWNQHAYHITNVNDDGTIPRQEQNSWLLYNNYRTQVGGEIYNVPDLAPSVITVTCLDGVPQLNVIVGNGGGAVAAPGVSIAYYDGASGTLIGTTSTNTFLDPGVSEKVSIPWTVPDGNYTVRVRVDDDGSGNGALIECKENNNECTADVKVQCLNCDFSMTSTGAEICAGDTVNLSANSGAVPGCKAAPAYQWWDGTFVIKAWDTNPAVTVNPTTTTTYRVEVKCSDDSSPCTSETLVTVLVHKYPLPDAGAEREICNDDTTVLDGSASLPVECAGTLEYQWRQGALLLQLWRTIPTISVFPVVTTTYTLDVRCSTYPACVSSDDVLIRTKPCPMAVRWGYFNVVHNAEGNAIRWATLSEVDTLGFYVVRSASGTEGSDNKIIALIESHGPGPEYSFVDGSDAAKSSQAFFYRIVELSSSGEGDKTPFFTSAAKEVPEIKKPSRNREFDRLPQGTVLRERGVKK